MSTRENIRLNARAPSFIIVSLDERNSVQGNNFHNCMQTDWFGHGGGTSEKIFQFPIHVC